MFSLRRHPSSPLLFRQRARPTPTYKTNIITNPATNTINQATNIINLATNITVLATNVINLETNKWG